MGMLSVKVDLTARKPTLNPSVLYGTLLIQ